MDEAESANFDVTPKLLSNLGQMKVGKQFLTENSSQFQTQASKHGGRSPPQTKETEGGEGE